MITFAFPIQVSANSDIKPILTLRIKNPPNENYYIAILMQESSSYAKLSSITGTSLYDRYNQEVITYLKEYNQDGWVVEKYNLDYINSQNRASFSLHTTDFYHDYPSNFKILVVTESLEVYVSNEITIDESNYFSSITTLVDFDISTQTLEQNFYPVRRHILRMVLISLMNFAITLGVELIVMLIFKLVSSHNVKRFLIANVISQIFLNASIKSDNLITIEIIIFIFEIIFYALTFKYEYNGTYQDRLTAINYGFVANLSSLILGFVFIILMIFSRV